MLLHFHKATKTRRNIAIKRTGVQTQNSRLSFHNSCGILGSSIVSVAICSVDALLGSAPHGVNKPPEDCQRNGCPFLDKAPFQIMDVSDRRSSANSKPKLVPRMFDGGQIGRQGERKGDGEGGDTTAMLF